MIDPSHLEAAHRIHSGTIVADIHSDIPNDVLRRRKQGETAVMQRLHVPQLRQGGVSLLTMATNIDSVVSGMNADAGLRLFVDMLDSFIEDAANTADIKLTDNVRQIRGAVADQKIAVLLGVEGAACIGESLGTIRTIYRLGVRTVTLTWNYRNAIGDGIAEEAGGGTLTRFGVSAVKEMQRLGILVDVSHLSVPGVMHTLAIAERPIVASHSNARALCGHLRNLPDEALVGIARSGGLVGVCPYPGFIDSERPSLSRLLDHVDYLMRLVGEDHIAIGADFIDYMQDEVRERLLAANVGYLPDTTYPEGIASVSDLPNLTAGLVARGYGEPVIRKILGGNYIRVLEQAM